MAIGSELKYISLFMPCTYCTPQLALPPRTGTPTQTATISSCVITKQNKGTSQGAPCSMTVFIPGIERNVNHVVCHSRFAPRHFEKANDKSVRFFIHTFTIYHIDFVLAARDPEMGGAQSIT